MLERLTGAQRDTLKFVSQGYSNYGVSIHMGINETTVRSYLTEIYGRLGIVDSIDGIKPLLNKRVMAVIIYREEEELGNV